jgi:hypothetical protein
MARLGHLRRSLRAAARNTNGDLIPVFAIVWIAATARVLFAISDHEVFGAETTSALAFAVLFPLLLIAPLVRTLLPRSRRHGRCAVDDGKVIPFAPRRRARGGGPH